MVLGTQIVDFSTSIFLRVFGVLPYVLDSGIITQAIVLCTLLVLPLHGQACSIHGEYGGVYILSSHQARLMIEPNSFLSQYGYPYSYCT